MLPLSTIVTGLATLGSAYQFGDTSGSDELAAQALTNQLQFQFGSSTRGSHNLQCNESSIIRRKEWNTLTPAEKKDYIDANLCLTKLPTRNQIFAPGARSRYDDFVGVHINQTTWIHLSGSFLSWHRYFMFLWEKALREECGYRGWQPYWNWGKTSHDPAGSPLFDGGPLSLSGDGAYEKHTGKEMTFGGITWYLPPGNGSGCLMSGPFKDMQVNLGPGPHASIYNWTRPNPREDGLGYNPRCIRRDINQWLSSRDLKDVNTTRLIEESEDLAAFQNNIQAIYGLPVNHVGVHGAGHFTLGGDPGADLYTSPGDPYFWVHHAQVDRVWWMWQNQNPEKRLDVVAGTRTMYDMPPMGNATLDDVIYVGEWMAPDKKIGGLVNTLEGPFCYVYE